MESNKIELPNIQNLVWKPFLLAHQLNRKCPSKIFDVWQLYCISLTIPTYFAYFALPKKCNTIFFCRWGSLNKQEPFANHKIEFRQHSGGKLTIELYVFFNNIKAFFMAKRKENASLYDEKLDYTDVPFPTRQKTCFLQE